MEAGRGEDVSLCFQANIKYLAWVHSLFDRVATDCGFDLQRKHRLQHEQRLLLQERRAQAERRERLLAERAALLADPFYLERTYSETWATKPHGVLDLDELDTPPTE